MDFSSFGNRVYHCSPLAHVLTREHLCSFKHHFSVSMLISGILEIIFAFSNRKGVPSWGWYIVGGLIDLVLGIYLIAYPMVSMEVIPFIIAFWLMFRGFSSTGYSIDLKRYGTRDWGWYMAFGILAILCSLLILWQPAIGALYAVYMISFTFLIIGLFRVMLSFELKICIKENKNLSALTLVFCLSL